MQHHRSALTKEKHFISKTLNDLQYIHSHFSSLRTRGLWNGLNDIKDITISISGRQWWRHGTTLFYITSTACKYTLIYNSSTAIVEVWIPSPAVLLLTPTTIRKRQILIPIAILRIVRHPRRRSILGKQFILHMAGRGAWHFTAGSWSRYVLARTRSWMGWKTWQY